MCAPELLVRFATVLQCQKVHFLMRAVFRWNTRFQRRPDASVFTGGSVCIAVLPPNTFFDNCG